MTADAGYLPVARFAKPHGLKGEAIVFALTEVAEQVLVEGAALTPVDDEGRPVGPPLTLERARPYHRRWLLKFRGVDERTPVEAWRGRVFAVPRSEVDDEAEGPLRDHEIAGAAVLVGGRRIGTARALLAIPGGPMLVMDREGREVLVPYRPPILLASDRIRREITIDPPDGLLEL